MVIDKVPSSDDLLDKWKDYAAKHGGEKHAIESLPENELKALYEITNKVKVTPFTFASDNSGAYKALALRLQNHSPKETDVESVQAIRIYFWEQRICPFCFERSDRPGKGLYFKT